jgi:energy-coupling factor transporter ATP-binding protein EcfA2
MQSLELSSFGPILSGTIEPGDLTVLVGPQASGKSLMVQLYKAIKDASAIRRALKHHGFDYGEQKQRGFLTLYFGGGMESIWSDQTGVKVDGKVLDLMKGLVNPRGRIKPESVFLIPAQRVLILKDGWPRSFTDYSAGDPFCLRSYSESLRVLMEQGLGSGEAIFPQKHRMKAELRRLIDDGIYVGGKLTLDTTGMRKRVVLQPYSEGPSLPYSAWSAGQREFTPLLLGLYWLLPPSKIAKKEEIETVVIEEPEMGLHPQAIMSFCLLVLELLHRGYRVILSTHSPVILDVVWSLQELKELSPETALNALAKIFKIKSLSTTIKKLLGSSQSKSYRAYYFSRSEEGVTIKDISSLDPGSEDDEIAGWGGVSGTSGHIADCVGEALMQGGLA